MENMDKGLTVPKWVLIIQPKIPQMRRNLSPQFACPGISVKKGFIGRRQSVPYPDACSNLNAEVYNTLFCRPSAATKYLSLKMIRIRPVVMSEKGNYKKAMSLLPPLISSYLSLQCLRARIQSRVVDRLIFKFCAGWCLHYPNTTSTIGGLHF